MTHDEALSRLDQRRRWLTERIKAKQTIGWDVEYDISERNALYRILKHLKYDDLVCEHEWLDITNHSSHAKNLLCSICGAMWVVPLPTICDPCYDEEKTT